MSFLSIMPTVVHSSPQAVAAAYTLIMLKHSHETCRGSGIITPTQWQQQQPYFALTLDKNPLMEFVKLPEEAIEGRVGCGLAMWWPITYTVTHHKRQKPSSLVFTS